MKTVVEKKNRPKFHAKDLKVGAEEQYGNYTVKRDAFDRITVTRKLYR